jgi:hypothetical protein
VLLIGACLQPPNLFIVMEWSEGGSLFSLLHQSSRAFDLRAIVSDPPTPTPPTSNQCHFSALTAPAFQVRTAVGIARALQVRCHVFYRPNAFGLIAFGCSSCTALALLSFTAT